MLQEKLKGAPGVLCTCKIQGAQHMVSMKKLSFPSHMKTIYRKEDQIPSKS